MKPPSATETGATVALFLWRRLDAPGHDACRLSRTPAGGWQLDGSAAFVQSGRVCALDYSVVADAAFRTRRAVVTGFIGRRPVALSVRAGPRGGWTIDGAPVPGVQDCIDIDLGFTPATNLLPIRRLALRVGQQAEAPALYLVWPGLRARRLAQRYARVGRDAYDYEAPAFGYCERLRVSAEGAVMHYPRLFERLPAAARRAPP